MSNFADQELTCKDCQQPFTFTAGEQEYFANQRDENGQPFTPPKRCKPCRQAKKAARQGGGGYSAPQQGQEAQGQARPVVVETRNGGGGGRRQGGGGRGRRRDEHSDY